MKKIAPFILVLVLILLVNHNVSYAASYFTNDKALDGVLKKLEKQFLTFEKDELLSRTYYELLPEEEREKLGSRPSKKISEKQKLAACETVMNRIKAALEIESVKIGGFTSKDYQKIENQLTTVLYLSAGSNYCWDIEGKYVYLYVDAHEDQLYEFRGLEGKFSTMGKEKDQVDQAALKVKDKISRYLNQSIQLGNDVSKDILKNLPAATEKLFIERASSKIVVARTLSRIYDSIIFPDYYLYDGSESVESLIDHYDYLLSSYEEERNEEKTTEYYDFKQDEPSAALKQEVIQVLLEENLTEEFTYGFQKTMTLNDLTKLYFGRLELDEKIVIENNIISESSPDYVKNAFIYGMIDDQNDLTKSLTRLEAARKLVTGIIYENGAGSLLRVADCNEIPFADQVTVATCIRGRMKLRVDKFEPKSAYTKEEAIVDKSVTSFKNLRGYNIPFSLSEPKKIVLGKNTIHLQFETTSEIKQYMRDNFDDTALKKVELTGKYTRIDTGCAFIELYTPETGIKFTIKEGVEYIDFDDNSYGPELWYKIEPKVVKSNDKVNMTLQADAIFTKLNAKLDGILAKIIKPKMTQEQKIKAIHDYVVTHITYDPRYEDEHTIKNLMTSIDKGRGVCGDYTLFFLHLCRRASIPCVYEEDAFHLRHAWNSVYVNGKWLFVDTTWDDLDDGKIRYTFYLKDKFTFMKSHYPLMGIPDEDIYTDIDKMNIKSLEELRGYLLQNFYWVDGFQLKFRMADKNLKPNIACLNDRTVNFEYLLKYDSKNNIYTLTAKKK